MPAPGGKYGGSNTSSRGYSGGSKFGGPQTGAAGSVSGGSVRSTAGGGGYGGYGGAQSTGRTGGGYSGSGPSSNRGGGPVGGGMGGGRGGGPVGGSNQGSQRTGPGMGFQGASMADRARAVSRGPGLGASMRSLNPADQERALTSVGLAYGDKRGWRGNLGIDRAKFAAKTAAGEVGRYGQLDYDAVAKTMENRMDLQQAGMTRGIGKTYGRMMQAYDANRTSPRTQTKKGLKQTKGAYEGFQAAVPGTKTFNKGLYAVANAMSPYSEISQAPARVATATHYFSGPRTASYQKGFQKFGTSGHKFGSPDYSPTQIASAQGLNYGGRTMTALNDISPGVTRGPTLVANYGPARPGLSLSSANIQPASYTSMTPRAKPDIRGLTMGMPRAKPDVRGMTFGMPRSKPIFGGGGLAQLGTIGGGRTTFGR